jgi:hypothetical protein
MTWQNSFRPIFVSAVPPLLLIALGCGLVALFAAPEVRWTGFVGIVALAGVIVPVLKNTCEAVAKANPLRVTPVILAPNTTLVVGVEVFYSSPDQVQTRRISLWVDGQLGEELAEESTAEGLEDGPVFTEFPEGVSRFEIGAKKIARFHLDRNTRWDWGKLLAIPPHSFWIEIECFGGAKVRVQGKAIQAAIENQFPGVSKWQRE